jgi:site-specific DNA-adenine methylase
MTFLRYPGSKSKLASILLEHLADARTDAAEYREPFLGGGSIAIAFAQNYPIQSTWLNDKDPGIASLFAATLENPENLKDLVVKFEPNVHTFYRYKQILKSATTMEVDPAQIVDHGFQKLDTSNNRALREKGSG